jgi:hypothetical protein
MDSAGTSRAPESPRIIAEIFRSLGSIESSIKTQSQQIDTMHKAIFIGNGRKSIFDWLVDHENKINRLLGHTREQKRHSLKVAGFSTLSFTAVILALKLIVFLLTNHWPTIP